MSGRPRKPAALRIAEGNRSRTEIPVEPAVAEGMPDKPAWLDRVAAAKWDELAPQLHGAGLLKAVDGDALATYCQTFAIWKGAASICAKRGIVAPTTNSRGAVVNAVRPEFHVAQKCLEQMTKLFAQFGLSPIGRAQLGKTGGGPVKPKDPFAEAMGA